MFKYTHIDFERATVALNVAFVRESARNAVVFVRIGI